MSKHNEKEILCSQKRYINKCRAYLAQRRTASTVALIKSILYNDHAYKPVNQAQEATAARTIRAIHTRTKKPCLLESVRGCSDDMVEV